MSLSQISRPSLKIFMKYEFDIMTSAITKIVLDLLSSSLLYEKEILFVRNHIVWFVIDSMLSYDDINFNIKWRHLIHTA